MARRKRFTAKDRARILAALEERTIPEPNSGCLLWTGAAKAKGYGHMYVDGRWEGAHRLAYSLYVGPIPDGMVVMHKCDNPACVNHRHLTIGTPRQNIHDCIKKNRARRGRFPGEMNPSAKLTSDQVREIRAEPRPYGYRIQLAKKYGVSPGTISKIVSGETWGCVE
mgnify:CR=1 FL=1